MEQYTTQMDAARKGIATKEMKIVAEKEKMPLEQLMKLVAEGKVMKYQQEDGKKAVFQYVEEHQCQNHLHMQCVKCGRMIHLNCGFMDEISDHMLEHHHFRLQCQNSILYGMCETCEKED